MLIPPTWIALSAGWSSSSVTAKPPSTTASSSLPAKAIHVFTPIALSILTPYSEQLRGNVHLTTALSAITAAVVGVVMNLAVWFAMHIVLPKDAPFNWFAAVV